MNFIIPYYCDERLKYTQKYLKNAGYNEVFDKSEANFAVFAPACDKEMFKGYENVHVFYGVGDYDKKYKNCYDYNKRDDFKCINFFFCEIYCRNRVENYIVVLTL